MTNSMEPQLSFTRTCPGCGRITSGEIVEIKDVEKEVEGWAVSGAAFCEDCGQAFYQVFDHLRIEFPAIPCPACEQIVEYSFKIERVRMEEEGFLFRATATCPQCHKVSIFGKIIKGLRRITGIKVGPVGIELKSVNSD